MPRDTGHFRKLLINRIVIGAVLAVIVPSLGVAQDAAEPKSIRMTCGTCPDGYATTGVTQSAEVCKDEDPTLVQCVPLGANMLSVCGSCPDGYAEIGSSSVPARCGSKDGGRLTRCPPDCGSTAQPGQGALPPPPKYQRMPESK
jgi:hypothetical protein